MLDPGANTGTTDGAIDGAHNSAGTPALCSQIVTSGACPPAEQFVDMIDTSLFDQLEYVQQYCIYN